MDRASLKNWAKEKIKGHIIELIIPIVIASVLTTLTIGAKVTVNSDGSYQSTAGYNIGIFFYFVQVGLAYFMVNFINDQPHEIKDLFKFSSEYVRTFLTGLLSKIFIGLWTLLLIVPGIMKAYGYALIDLILINDKYKDLGYMDLLKKSEEIMNGHKMDLFLLDLSFIGWHILSIFTCFILEVWVLPYHQTARYKFMDDLMKAAN